MRALLERHKARADKSFGQNFLVDKAALAAIVAAAELRPDSVVFEVGPGLGTLTVELARRAARVVSVELDPEMLPVLAETLDGLDNVELVNADALTFDLTRLPSGSLLVANLPYNVATPLIVRALESGRFARLVFLVQREVGDRLVAGAGDAAYGALSLIVERFTRARRVVRHVAPGAFMPPPKVTSSVVRLDVDPLAVPDPGLVRLIHEAFAHRRKTLRRNLLYAAYPEPAVDRALAHLGLDAMVRAEALPLTQFERLRPLLEHTGRLIEID
ncbi:MAG TPA: 16S rRNA (adenine(1518)-N(6)/adenine(1519)-N(6))-dimethyltransferase RsmA [Trueperaceae bacterium]|nr:16S rRNA (adenine(1518)-N(6)/adenine(1519)-N(6))-dimethyltransferase RsmA [Trueperaceae bacterium]